MISGPDAGLYPPPGVLVTGHFRERFGYRVRRPGGSGNWLLTYTVSGCGVFRQPGVSFAAGPGDVVLLEPGAAHDYSVPEARSWEFSWAHFQPRVGWFEWLGLPAVGEGLYLARLDDPRARDRVRGAFAGVHADALVGQGLPEELALNGVEEVLLVAAREAERSGGKKIDGRVRRVLAVLSEDPAAPHDLASLAREVALSPSRLSHLFKQETGDSVTSTLLGLRLRQAARLLEHTGESVAEISHQTGFRSPYYFSRQFRRHYGVSPRRYRQAKTPGEHPG